MMSTALKPSPSSPTSAETTAASRLRVLFFANRFGGGGAEKHFLRVINGLDRERCVVGLAVARGGGSYEPLLKNDVEVHTLTSQVGGSSMLALGRCVQPFRNLIHAWQPDILCSAMEFPNATALFASRIAPSHRPSLVLCVQAPPSRVYPGSSPVSRAGRATVRHLYRHADHVISLSEGVARDLAQFDARILSRTSVIYNAIVDDELTAELSDARGVPERSGPTLVACGRLAEQKGFDHLLKALALVRQKVPAELWLLGEGPLEAQLRAQAADLGIQDAVHFLGFVSNPGAVMAAADVFVLSSNYEGFGNVVAEAMACGTAVVSTNCPHGPSEIIDDGKTGLLVPVANPAALANAAIRLLEDDALRTRFVDGARATVRRFEAKHIATQYESLFTRLRSPETTTKMTQNNQQK